MVAEFFFRKYTMMFAKCKISQVTASLKHRVREKNGGFLKGAEILNARRQESRAPARKPRDAASVFLVEVRQQHSLQV